MVCSERIFNVGVLEMKRFFIVGFYLMLAIAVHNFSWCGEEKSKISLLLLQGKIDVSVECFDSNIRELKKILDQQNQRIAELSLFVALQQESITSLNKQVKDLGERYLELSHDNKKLTRSKSKYEKKDKKLRKRSGSSGEKKKKENDLYDVSPFINSTDDDENGEKQ